MAWKYKCKNNFVVWLLSVKRQQKSSDTFKNRKKVSEPPTKWIIAHKINAVKLFIVLLISAHASEIIAQTLKKTKFVLLKAQTLKSFIVHPFSSPVYLLFGFS